MKFKKLIFTIVLVTALFISFNAYAGPETRCYAYGNANALAYCLQSLSRSGVIRTVGMDPATAQLYAQVASQPVVPPTVIPAGNVYVGSYGAVPAPYIQSAPHPLSVVGGVAANMMAAAAWAHNWREGYIGAQGLYGASYLMNYPW